MPIVATYDWALFTTSRTRSDPEEDTRGGDPLDSLDRTTPGGEACQGNMCFAAELPTRDLTVSA